MNILARFTPDSPICPQGDAGLIGLKKLILNNLGEPLGDETLTLDLTMAVPAPIAIDPRADGVQLLLEDEGRNFTSLFDLSAITLPVPSGGPGSGCMPKDGWAVNGSLTAYKYRNFSGALPPTCAPGSAQGLTSFFVTDTRARNGKPIALSVRTKGSTILAPLVPSIGVAFGELRLSINLQGTVGGLPCAIKSMPLPNCKLTGAGRKLTCR